MDLFIYAKQIFLKNNSFVSKETYGYIMDKLSSIDIDDEADLQITISLFNNLDI